MFVINLNKLISHEFDNLIGLIGLFTFDLMKIRL